MLLSACTLIKPISLEWAFEMRIAGAVSLVTPEMSSFEGAMFYTTNSDQVTGVMAPIYNR
jgi:hypothetical protein